MPPPDDDAALAALVNEVQASADALLLAEQLMRFCRQHEASYHEWHADPAQEAALPDWDRRANHLLREELDDFDFTEEDRNRIIEFLRSGAGIPAVVRAKVLLGQVAARYTPQIQTAFSRRPAGPLQPEQLFPVFRPQVRSIIGSEYLGTNPDSRPQRAEYVPGLGLAPADLAGIQVAFDFSQEHQLSAFGTTSQSLKLAIGILNKTRTSSPGI
jgi:hypothetical protein